jgi:hypothetical protein
VNYLGIWYVRDVERFALEVSMWTADDLPSGWKEGLELSALNAGEMEDRAIE